MVVGDDGVLLEIICPDGYVLVRADELKRLYLKLYEYEKQHTNKIYDELIPLTTTQDIAIE